MNFFSSILVAIDALMINKGRSVLTSLGLVIGISAVIAMVSAGGGARQKLDERLESVGKNLILIRSGGKNQQGVVADVAPLTRADADAVRKQVGPLLLGVAESQITQKVVSSKNRNWPTAIVGSVPDLQRVRNWHLLAGRFYNDEEVRNAAPVCLIGQTARRELFPDKPRPIGEWVRVDQVRLRIIGILDEKGRSPTGADQDDQLFVPITTLQRQLVGKDRIELIVATARSDDVVEKAQEEIIKVMKRMHKIQPGAADDFEVSTVRELSELAELFAATMQALVGLIASISLVVGGIGIMNIMLTSVTERTREIGIRMAVGATPANVLSQFLIEAVILSLVGGLLGISLGIAGAVALAQLADWPLVVSPEIVILAFGVSAGVGIFFGYYPAWRASRLDPIEALRYE
jgi:putative ABC transport system permease protein